VTSPCLIRIHILPWQVLKTRQTLTVITISASVLCWLANLLLAAALWNFKREVKRIDDISGEVDSVKHNYLSRFDELKNTVLEQMGPIKEDVAVMKARLEFMSRE
jgi:hypothetical protein